MIEKIDLEITIYYIYLHLQYSMIYIIGVDAFPVSSTLDKAFLGQILFHSDFSFRIQNECSFEFVYN